MRRVPHWTLPWIALGCGPRVHDGTAGQGDATSTVSTTSSASTDVGSSTSPFTTSTSTTSTSTTTTSGTSEGTTTTNAADDSTSYDSVGYIQDPDGGCTSSQCSVWAQDCPAGEKCVPWSAGGDGPGDGCAQSRCSEVAPDPRAPGESCIAEDAPWSGLDDCELGAYCWYVDEITLEGVCVASCEGSIASPSCADPALSCFIFDGTALTACVPQCDPLAPACAPGSTCVLAEANDRAPVCVPASLDLPTGEAIACEWPNGCGDGFACVDGATVTGCDAPHCCAALCDLDAPICTDENPECWALEGAPVGVGACRTPKS